MISDPDQARRLNSDLFGRWGPTLVAAGFWTVNSEECRMNCEMARARSAACVSSINAGHGADPPVPSTCWPYGGSAPLGRAQEHRRPSFCTRWPCACTLARIFGRILTRTQRSSLRAGSTCISQSSAGPIDGAGDGIQMGTSELLCESYLSQIFEHVQHRPFPRQGTARLHLMRGTINISDSLQSGHSNCSLDIRRCAYRFPARRAR